MKKLLKTFILLILLTFNVFSMDENLGVIHDPFFKDPNCRAQITQLVPHEKEIIAVVEGTINDGTNTTSKTTTVKPIYTSNWLHLDDILKSKTNVHATVIVGSQVISGDVTKLQDFPYLFLKEYEYQEGVLAENHPVNVYVQKDYERPDKTIYTQRVKLLHTLTLTRETVAVGKVSLCVHEWSIFSKWQKKLRHKREFFDAFDIYHITTKTLAKPAGNEPQHVIEYYNEHHEEQLSRNYFRKEIKHSHFQDEGPECGSLGRNIPAGIQRI